MRINRLLPLLAMPFVIWGCGGGGTGSLGGSSPLLATYKASFARGVTPNTTLVMFVDRHNHIGAQINSGTEVEYAGQGTVAGNSITVSLQAVGGSSTGTVLLQGTILPGAPPTVSITLTGAVSASTVATQVAGADSVPYSGTFSGTYEGSEPGTFFMTINSQGDVSGSVNSPLNGNGIAIQGSVDLDGAIHFQYLVTGGLAHYDGYMFLAPGSSAFQGEGDWDFNSMSGDWTASPSVL